MAQTKTKRLVGIAAMAAIAFIISRFDFPIFPTVPFLKIDFSDIPIFFGMYVFGPVAGVFIAFIRSLLGYVVTGGEAGFPVGAIASFVASVSLTLPLYYFTVNKKLNLKTKLLAGLVASLVLAFMLTLSNYFFVLPAYLTVMGFDITELTGSVANYIIYFLVPFNLIKGALVSSLVYIVYERMATWLNKQRKRYFKDPIDQQPGASVSNS